MVLPVVYYKLSIVAALYLGGLSCIMKALEGD